MDTSHGGYADDPDDRRCRTAAALALLAGPVLLIGSDLLRAGDDSEDGAGIVAFVAENQSRYVAGSVLALVALAFLGGCIFHLSRRLRPLAPRLADVVLVAGLVGTMGGTAINALFLTFGIAGDEGLDRAALATYVDHVLEAPAVTTAVFLPGLLFPLSILVAAVALVRRRAVPTAAGWAIVAGAVLFPIGRIAVGDPAIFLSDACWLFGLGSLGLGLLGRSAPSPVGQTTATVPA